MIDMIGIILVGFFAGIISAMGIGGGTILIPAFLFLFDFTQTQVQGINLLFFLPTATIALYIHNKNQVIDWGRAKPITLYGIIGAILGSWLALSLEATFLKKIFASFLFVMGVRELLTKETKEE